MLEDELMADVPYLQGLTLIQPMASALVARSSRRKRTENRPRALPRLRLGRPTAFAIHAGLKWSERYASTCLRVLTVDVDWDRAANLGGRILGLGRLSGRQFSPSCPPPTDDPWWEGPVGYEVVEASPLDEPILCRGGRGWWPVPPDVTRRVLEQLPDWRGIVADTAALVRPTAQTTPRSRGMNRP